MNLKPMAALLTLALLAQPAAAGTADDLLLRAIHAGDHAGAAVQLDMGADPGRALADGSSPLAWAVDSGDREMVALLLQHGATTATVNPAVAPLFVACQYGDAALLDLLLDAGAEVGTAHPDGLTALAR